MGRLIGLVVVVALVVGGIWYWRGGNAGTAATDASDAATAATTTDPYTAGDGYYKSSKYLSAIEKYKEALEKNPKDPRAPIAQYQTAMSYEGLQQNDKAIEAYRTYLDTYPKDGPERIAQAKKRWGLLTGQGSE